MGYFNKRAHIDQILLKVKIGNRDEFNRLKEMYSFLLDQIYNSLAENYPFLRDRKVDLFHDFYFFFWEAINEYDFNSDFSFSYHLKNSLIKNARKAISEQYGYEKEAVIEEDLIRKHIVKTKPIKHRKIINRALKALTAKQKRVIYLHCYRHNTYDKCRNITELSGITIIRMLRDAYRRLNRNLIKVKKGTKRVKYREKVHKIYQEKMETIK